MRGVCVGGSGGGDGGSRGASTASGGGGGPRAERSAGNARLITALQQTSFPVKNKNSLKVTLRAQAFPSR